MHDFIFRELDNCDSEKELLKIGFDKSYIKKGAEKFLYKNIKIYSVTSAQANIIKQTALSLGADCATHRDVITGKAEISDCILTGSISQLKKIADKLKFQPFNLKTLGEELINSISNSELVSGSANKQPLKQVQGDMAVGNLDSCFLLPKIVGILNITENSFSDGGMYNDLNKAKDHLSEMISEGADIIDIGAESTKPYSEPVSDKEQLEKLLPVIEFAKGKIKLSIDTRSSTVAEECLKAGADIINDVSGMTYDSKMADVISKYNCPVIIQHSKGEPQNMQDNPKYNDLMEEIYLDLDKKCKSAKSKGIENIIIDPGIGFGKSREDNFEIIRRLSELKTLGYPIMLGISRKSFLNLTDNNERDIYTTAFNALAIERQVDYIRVHNVKMHKTLVDLMKFFMI